MEYKTERKTFRLTPKELKIIEEKALKCNLTISEYLRKASLNKQIIVVKDIKEFTKELRGIEKNLSQLKTLSDQGKISIKGENSLMTILDTVDSIRQLLNYTIKD